MFVDQAKGLDANRHRVKTFTKTDETTTSAMFLVVLEGMVYTVGALFGAAALYLASRLFHGQSLPFMNVFNPDSAVHEVYFCVYWHCQISALVYYSSSCCFVFLSTRLKCYLAAHSAFQSLPMSSGRVRSNIVCSLVWFTDYRLPSLR